MIAKFNIFDNDLIAQQRHAINNTKFHKKGRMMQIILSFVFALFILIVAGYSINFVVFGFVLCLILVPLIWKSYEYGLIKRYKKDIVKQHKHKIYIVYITKQQRNNSKSTCSCHCTKTI